MGFNIGLSDALIGNKIGADAAEAKARQDELDARQRIDWAHKNEADERTAQAARAQDMAALAKLPKEIPAGTADAKPAYAPMTNEAIAAGLGQAKPARLSLTGTAVDSAFQQEKPAGGLPHAKPTAQVGMDAARTSSETIAQKYNAATDDNERKALFAAYQDARTYERSTLAKRAQTGLEAGDPSAAVEWYNKTVADGRNVKSAVEKDANTLLVTYDNGETKEVNKVALHRMLLDVQKPGSQTDLGIKGLEERAKADANIYQAENDGNKVLRLSQAREHAAKAASEKSGGALSLAQLRRNAEIDKARELVGGMSMDEIKRRTSKATDTGRENPYFDPTLERQVRLANSRKYGQDADFDQKSGQQPKQGAADRNMLGGRPMSSYSDSQLEKSKKLASPSARFRIEAEQTRRAFGADAGMQGNSLGERTPHGFEVFGANGELLGYWN